MMQPIETAPKSGEIILIVENAQGAIGRVIGHYMEGGHCIEDHPPIDEGWYFWSGSMYVRATNPTHWESMGAEPSFLREVVEVLEGLQRKHGCYCERCMRAKDLLERAKKGGV
jgi:hypothetical protein